MFPHVTLNMVGNICMRLVIVCVIWIIYEHKTFKVAQGSTSNIDFLFA